MLAVISPAKKLDFDRTDVPDSFTQSEFLGQTKKLMVRGRKLSVNDLKGLMNISDDLGELNRQRFKAMKLPFTPDNAKQAAYAFNGDTYAGLQAATFDDGDLSYAQDHLRILSGLYGLIRPLDLIQPYRLEMGIKLDTDRGSNLYQFWGDRLSRKISNLLKEHENPLLINLASTEYFKAVRRKTLKAKVIGFSAKRARGMMARYMIANRIDQPGGLKDFSEEGYSFQPGLSSGSEYVFTRVIS